MDRVGALVGFIESNGGQEFIATGSRHFQVPRFQGHPDALGGVVRFVEGEMAPPGAPIVPQMVVGIVRVDPDGQLARNALGIGLFTD